MDTSNDLRKNVDQLFGKYRIPISEISAETWLVGLADVYHHPLIPGVPDLFVTIAELMKGNGTIKIPVPRGFTTFEPGLGINTAVRACLAHESYRGNIIQQTPPLWDHTEADFLLLLNPAVDEKGPLRWATWHLEYQMVPVEGRAYLQGAVLKSTIRWLDLKAVLHLFSTWPHAPLRLFELAAQKIRPHIATLRNEAGLLEMLADKAIAALVHVKY